MGILIGIISAVLILAAIYLKIGDEKNKLSKILFFTGIVGTIAFALILVLAIYD